MSPPLRGLNLPKRNAPQPTKTAKLRQQRSACAESIPHWAAEWGGPACVSSPHPPQTWPLVL